ncbi:hypothetical protein AB0M38_03350 [Streptomyces sp. NPDC051742]|uniref:hypothetical protein n=1 Tax=unclassified Streptomyces TaxID=2593676 RepID=UPI00341F0C69
MTTTVFVRPGIWLGELDVLNLSVEVVVCLRLSAMDPTIKGAIIGAVATAVGGAIAWLGARSQAKAALEAVRIQARSQRMDGLWQMRRAAYGDLLDSVETLRSKIGAAADAVGDANRHGAHTLAGSQARDRARVAREEMHVALAAMRHKCTVLGLSVTPLEAETAESFSSVVSGVAHDLITWEDAIEVLDGDRDELRRIFFARMESLPQSVDHFIDMTRGYLQTLQDVTPERRRRFWQRSSVE